MPPWKFVNPLPTPRSWLAAATCNAPAPQSGSWIYAIGGGIDSATNSVSRTVEAYDTSTKSWSTPPPIQPMLTARIALAAASGSDGLHALGGVDASLTAVLATHEIYDPATNAWSPARVMLTARAGHAAVTGPDGLIYAIGGVHDQLGDAGSYLTTVEAYDPTTGGPWQPKGPMNTSRCSLAAVTGLDGLIYAIGGTNSEGAVSTVEAYDPTLDKWVYKLSLPAARYCHAAAVDPQGLIYAIGGIDWSNDPQPVYSYDPAHPTAEWTEQYPLLTAQILLAAATGPDGLIYAIGGSSESPPTVVGPVEAYTPGPPPPLPDPCADIRAQIESFNPGDYQNSEAALAAIRSFLSAFIACEREHGRWPVTKG
jgi:hypothetical protein